MDSGSVAGGYVCTAPMPRPWQCSTMSNGLPLARAARARTENAVGAPPIRGLPVAAEAPEREVSANHAAAGAAMDRTCLRESMRISVFDTAAARRAGYLGHSIRDRFG